jgi:hypothetical protein
MSTYTHHLTFLSGREGGRRHQRNGVLLKTDGEIDDMYALLWLGEITVLIMSTSINMPTMPFHVLPSSSRPPNLPSGGSLNIKPFSIHSSLHLKACLLIVVKYSYRLN